MNTNKASVQIEALTKKVTGTLTTFLIPILLVLFFTEAIPFIRHDPVDYEVIFGNIIINDFSFACLNLSIITTIQCIFCRTYNNKTAPASWCNIVRFLIVISIIFIVFFAVFISTKNNMSLENNKAIKSLVLTSDVVNKTIFGVSIASILINVALQAFIDVDSVLVSETK